MSLLSHYGFFGCLRLVIDKFLTLSISRHARIIRRPFDIRGKDKIKIGKGFTTGRYCRLEAYGDKPSPALIIGIDCQINDSVHIAAGECVKLGDNVLIASRVFITDLNHGAYVGENQSHPDSICRNRELSTAPVYIESNVWLGEGVVVLPGVVIGKSSIIGANSVVTKSIPEHSIAVGNPAKVIKRFDYTKNMWIKYDS
ncbi:TPA: DapH/DapD/GlmU-related protein [Enterobacter ludwigii]|uniref:DapH/DapD/GlmU-related protein n=1 Tax=Enterobacter TaxID=547 RepID=UPI0015F6B620|nr:MULTISPECIES: DapH/DapD/GlmU-related protein [Enterobacter]MBA7773600.1 acetyltransferase [Enterobacter sp. RHBSTW-00974]MBA7778763.1 acetyltransferase [Enterobacter sp. RHBSTW-00318]MBA7831366.1 acetyltransferase [Enterobacter sp. RHBSTW-00340]MBA8039062.1 acetyltransferase [Enterobacter sp. RHBSTW-00131]MBG0587026.1 acetyltransferase [Enterobacter ludwigii]